MPETGHCPHCGGTGKIGGGRHEQPDVLSKRTEETQADSDRLRAAQTLVGKQADDEGLWFVTTTAVEAHLQRELRRLHAVIAGKG